MVETEQDEMPSDGSLGEGYAAGVEVPLCIPVQDASRSRGRIIGALNSREVLGRIADFAVPHIGEQRDNSQVIRVHGLEHILSRDREAACNPAIAMYVRVSRVPASELRVLRDCGSGRKSASH